MWERLKNSRIFWISLLIVGTLGAIALIWYLLKPKTEETDEETIEEKPEKVNDQAARMYKYLIDSGVDRQTALILVAQSMHETGVFTSKLCTEYKNYYGMKQPVKRETTSIGKTPNGYASYSNAEQSINDLVLWLKEFNSPDSFSSVSEYVSFIKSKGYFEDTLTNYMSAVSKHYNSIKYLA